MMYLLNDKPITLPSPLMEMHGDALGVILMLCHHESIHTGDFHKKGYFNCYPTQLVLPYRLQTKSII